MGTCFKIYAAIILSICAQESALSQPERDCKLSLRGHIADIQNGLPVAYVVVVIKETGSTTSSDSLGNFSFSHLCTGDYTIQCLRIGFQTLTNTVNLTTSQSLDLHIDFDPTLFHTVEISSTRKVPNSTQITGSINGKALDAVRGNALGEILKGITGLNSLNTGPGISKPVIHGLHSNRILILNNGIRQEGQQWGNEHAPEIDPFITDKITVIKGAGTVLYGSDAIAGVILVDPKDMRSTPGIGGELHLVGSSNGRAGVVSGNIDGASKKIKGLSGRAQGTFKESGNVSTAHYYLKNTGLKEYDYSMTACYQRKKFGAQLYHSQFNTDVGIFSASHIGNLSDLQRAFASDVPLESSGFSYKVDRPNQHISHEILKVSSYFLTGTKGKLNLIYARQYNLRNEFDKHRPLNDSLAALNLPELHLEITTHTGELNWEQISQGPFHTQVGISAINQANTYEGRFFIPNFINRGAGLFAIEKWKHKKIELEGGIRYDVRHLEIFMYELGTLISPDHRYHNMSGTLALHYTLSKEFSFTINAGSAWRAPQASELYSNGLHHGAAAVEIGDKTLSAEQAWNLQGAISFVYNKLKVEIDPYYNYIHRFIYLSPQLPATLTIRGAFPTFLYKQADATFKGIDFTGSLDITKKLSTICRVSLLRAWNKTADDFLILMPADKYEGIIEYRLKDKSRLTANGISTSLSYTNKQWRVPANSDFAPPPSAYFLVGFNASTTIKLGKHQAIITLGASNLLNRSYRDYMNRFRYYADDQGRNISLRIKIPFNLEHTQS